MSEQSRQSGDIIRKASRATVLLQGFSAVLLLLLGLILYEISNRYASLEDGIRENSLWSVFQLDRETRQLTELLSDTLHHPATWRVASKDLSNRFDILYSRMTILEQASFEQSFASDANILGNIATVKTSLGVLTPFFDRLAAGESLSYAELFRTANVARGMVRQTGDLLTLANSTVSTARADARDDLLAIQIKAGVVIGLLVVCVLFLIVTLRRQLSSVRDAGLSLETMANALSAAYLDAQAGNSAKSQFLATIGHEVRTPLNAILGTAELLELSALPADTRHNVQTIRRSGQSLLEIINEILDFAKIENGKMEIELHPVNVLALATDVADMIRDRAAENGNTMRFLAPESLSAPWVLSDATRLRQVLLNLLSNAVKFTRGGSVTLEIREFREDGRLWFGADVSDTGIGIDADGLTKLFQPFSQVDASITRRFGGTGLGLTICKEIVETLGGRIGVRSTKGEGSTFWFELPVTEASAPVYRPTVADAVSQRLQPMQVLLVEDNAVNQDVAMRYLKHMGHTVTIANDGTEAVTLAAGQRFDLILMDMHMPKMDGIEATRRIRAAEADLGDGQHTPIVAMTANASDRDRNLCLEAGMDDFQSKPISLKTLQTVFRRYGTPDTETAPPNDGVTDASPETAVARNAASDIDAVEPLFAERRAEVISVLGEEDFAALVGSFFEDADALLKELAHIETLDPAIGDQILHTLRGAASNIGLQSLAQRCQDLRHQRVQAGDIEKLSEDIADMKQRLAA
ncbi:Signal transduction histidine kinase [Rhizobium sp. RU20A]|uniref:ATP-binding protein n=1 Tax=Rhizobium sp. RU20A TaxID=1907412 RepID=UPI000955D4CB|nr:ATP-binding protein [Rhizobium sp. RU20A]SIQ74524.1 Signal transduction histidine kinase [Rhizobium sp. RU20A]